MAQRDQQQALDVLLEALYAIRCGAADSEAALHTLTAQALARAGIDFEHEAVLGPRCRIDFMAGDIGVEIKKSRPQRAALMTQLARYAACDQVSQLVVIAPRGVSLPARIGGKRVTMVALERLWGVCLP